MTPSPHPSQNPTRSRQMALWRDRADRFIHHPITDMVVVFLILAAVAALLGEAAVPRESKLRYQLATLGDGITTLFVIELVVRFWVAPRKRRFLARYWLDILAVLPLARPLRLLRVLLLLRLFRAGILLNRRLRMYSGILRGTLNELTVVATLSVTIVLVGAMTLDFAGGGVRDQLGLNGNLESHLWYAVYTLIGGEPIGGMPDTELGRAVTLALMLGGMTVFGVFVGAVSASMVTVLSKRLEVGEMEMDELSGHVIVCGWNPAGPTMLRELFAEGERPRPVVVVTETGDRPSGIDLPDLPVEFIYHHVGDYTRVEVLEEVGVRRASAAILLTESDSSRSSQDRDARTVLAALTIERMVPGIFCCAELINGEHAPLLQMANVEEVVVRDWYAGVIIGSMGRNRGLSAVLNDILTTTDGNAFHKVQISRRNDGRSIGELHAALKQEFNAILVSWEGARDGARSTEVNPDAALRVRTGDVLVIITDRKVKL